MTEASSTTSFMLGCLATFRAQLLGQTNSRRNIFPHAFLRPANPAPQRRNPQLTVFHPQVQCASSVHSKRFPYLGWNYNPAFFAHACSSLQFHMSLTVNVTPFYSCATFYSSGTI